MGNPSGPAGHLPCKAEEFCLRTDKLARAFRKISQTANSMCSILAAHTRTIVYVCDLSCDCAEECGIPYIDKMTFRVRVDNLLIFAS